MKKDKKYSKLSLDKMSIAKLTNPHKIWGGTGDDPGDGTDTKGDKKMEPKEPKCIETSQKIVWE